MHDLKSVLRRKHGPAYTPVQYAMWAEMFVGGGHDSMDNPPPTPMFGATCARGKTNAGVNNMTEAFTALAGSCHLSKLIPENGTSPFLPSTIPSFSTTASSGPEKGIPHSLPCNSDSVTASTTMRQRKRKRAADKLFDSLHQGFLPRTQSRQEQ